MFVIAHRLSTIQNTDVIMVLQLGHIIERGSHDQLMRGTRQILSALYQTFELGKCFLLETCRIRTRNRRFRVLFVCRNRKTAGGGLSVELLRQRAAFHPFAVVYALESWNMRLIFQAISAVPAKRHACVVGDILGKQQGRRNEMDKQRARAVRVDTGADRACSSNMGCQLWKQGICGRSSPGAQHSCCAVLAGEPSSAGTYRCSDWR